MPEENKVESQESTFTTSKNGDLYLNATLGPSTWAENEKRHMAIRVLELRDSHETRELKKVAAECLKKCLQG